MDQLKKTLKYASQIVKEEVKNLDTGRKIHKYIIHKAALLLAAAAGEDREDIKAYAAEITAFIVMNGPQNVPEDLIKFQKNLESSMKKYEMEKENLLDTLRLSLEEKGDISVEDLFENFGEDPDVQYEYAIESAGALIGNIINLEVTEKPFIKIKKEESDNIIKNILMVLYSYNLSRSFIEGEDE